MQTTVLEQYRTYTPKPFTKDERDRVTILFGGLHWRAERLLQGGFSNMGYRAQVLPTASREDLLTGREVADIGQCCPTSFTTGNLVNFLRGEAKRIGEEEVGRRYVYITAGSCGACRFGQYHQSYELALRSTGLDAFRMFLLAQDGLDQGAMNGGGLEINMPFTMGAVWAILCADVLQDLEYQVRPYEVVAGQTDQVVRESVEYLHEAFRMRPHRGQKWGSLVWHLTTDYFVKSLREVRRRFDAIEVDRLRVKPVAKITGEFYLQTVEGDPNYNIHRWLEAEGAEVSPAVVAVWLDYLMRLPIPGFEEYVGIDRYRPQKKAHMTCELSPYACMPNTMSIGAMAGVIGRYPDLLYAPLEIKGDAEVHALSRCQMILTEAKKRAQREYQ